MGHAWNRSNLAVIFGAWTLFGLFFAGQAYLGHAVVGRAQSWTDPLWRWMLCAYAWALLTPLVMWLSRRFPFDRRRWPLALLVHAPASVAFSLVGMVLFSLGEQLLLSGGHFFTREAFTALFLAGFHIDLLIYASLVGSSYAVEHYRRYRERELLALQLQAALAEAELAALKAQLHPHFLFNTLNTISILLAEDPRAARKMLVHLSDLLRMVLNRERGHEVSVRQEVELLESYLEIERLRFQDRLQVQLRVDPEALDARVPDLVLQPLVENAIKHGVVPRPGGGKVEVSVHRRNTELRLEVRDDGPGLEPSAIGRGKGLGLSNTRHRLEKLYGRQHQFELENAEAGGLSVVLTIPFAPFTSSFSAQHAKP
jgi:signal transduction histidine kinase